MPKQKRIGKILPILLILVFVFTPIKFENLDLHTQEAQGANILYITEDTIWKKADNVTLNRITVIIKNGATLTIEKGATITIGVNQSDSAYIYVFDGNIIAEGTKEEKITFNVAYPDFNNYGIFFKGKINNDPSFLRYVDFINGGYYPLSVFQNKGLINKTYAAPLIGGVITYGSGKVHVENSEFKNSFAGAINFDVYEGADFADGNYLEIVNSNFKDSNSQIAVVASHYCESGSCKARLTLENNWYGNYAGPESGERVLGDCPLPNFRNNDLISDPVIVIPGIMGSFDVGGKLLLDPIFKTYDNLTRSLDQNGYQKNINLFEFPYEWRNGNEITAGELKNKIQAIKSQTKVSRVDLVAHSMGGLISRAYIEGENYQNDVDQLITLGTPHKGTPVTYLKWEAAEGFDNFLDKLGKKFFELEAKHNGYTDLGKYIREKVISVGELLPDYNYLEDGGVMRNYPIGYPRNEFLEGLNDPNNLSNLEKVDFTNIISQNKSTISKFRIMISTEDGKWEHGMPENYYDNSSDQGMEYDNGDKTVPLVSSTGITSNNQIELEAAHNQLPSRAQCKILVELSNKTEAGCSYINDVSEIVSLLTFGVFSPIDIQVEAPDKKKVGKDFVTGEIINEIVGAYYTGAGTENEFLTIPNPVDGEYKILTEGIGDGEYKIEVAKITENPETGIASESVAVIQGIAMAGQEDEREVEVRGVEVLIENQDTLAPEISITVPEENRNYLNNQILKINYTVLDNVSQNFQTEVALDGNIFTKDNIDFRLQNLGEHKFKITATDEAENRGEKEIIFEIKTSVEAMIDNVNHYASLGLIKKKADKTVLISRLELIWEIKKLKDGLENSWFFNSKVRKNLIEVLNEQINRHLDWLIRHVQQRSRPDAKNGIDPKVGELLLESLNFVKYN